MAARKSSTIKTIANKVADAASAVIHAADDHVIHPVGEALGLITKPEPKGKTARKAFRKEQIQNAENDSSRKKPSAARMMMTKVVKPSKVRKPPASQTGPGPKLKGR